MPSLIEALIGGGTPRPDNKRILPSRRPLPARPRDLFELFGVLGRLTTFPSIIESADLRQADARHISFITLNRWPTLEELTAQPDPYVARKHLRRLLLGQEFRTSLVRRICDAYPERQRLFHVILPRCAGEHFHHMADTLHPIIPHDLPIWRERDEASFLPALGTYLGRFSQTRTIQFAQPRLSAFIQAKPAAVEGPPMEWSLNPPPRRTGDRLFTILREPASLILSQVNAILTSLRVAKAGDAQADTWRAKLGALPSANDTAGWQSIGTTILASLSVRNPICQALGQGTAATALDSCRLCDIEIADLSLYQSWVRFTWDVEPEPATNVSEPILTERTLDPASTRHLDSLIDQDRIFYAPIAAALAKLDTFKTVIKGREL